MKFEDLKKGSVVHWVANRMFKAWNVYAVVEEITENEATFLTLDNFENVILYNGGDAIKNEITPATPEDLKIYLLERKLKNNYEKDAIQLKMLKEMQVFENENKKIEEFLEKWQ